MQVFKKLCVLLLVLCLLVGVMPIGTLATEETETKVVKQQILLGVDLTMRFFVNIREEHRTNGVMNIRVGNRSVDYVIADMTPNEEGCYVFNMELSAAEMTEDVTLTLTNGNVNGPLKLSGTWFVSKEDYAKIQVGEGEAVNMTNAEIAEPEDTDPNFITAIMPAQESAEIDAASSMVARETDHAWAGIASQATMKAAGGITIIGDQKSVVIDSPIGEGYANEGGKTYPEFALNCGWGKLDTATQDIMFYIELPATSSSVRLGGVTCNSWSFWAAPSGMEYQYLAMDSYTWVDGTVSTEGNKTLELPQGFQGYVRLKVNTAENAASFPDATLTVQNFTFQCDRFGGENGALKIGGVWFASKEDYIKIRVGEGKTVKMTNAEAPDYANWDYMSAVIPAQESAEIDADSSMVTIGDDPAWAGISSQATMKAAEGITLIGDQKSVVIDSPIGEGYFNENGKTYPQLDVNCGWGSLNTETQDIMFYVELPAVSSGLRMNSITCNGWAFWAAPSGMQYQYLAMDSNTWVNGTISTEGNKTLELPQGFKGYVRLKVNTAENAASFPDTTLTVQSFGLQCDRFGGENGALKLSGVWFVSKEEYMAIQVGEGNPVKMTNAEFPDNTPPDYITGTAPAQEGAEVGAASTMVTIGNDPAWAGISSQATMKAAEGITLIGDQKSVVIDSPIGEGYFNESGKTYPQFDVNCGWGSLNTATQDIMFYVELPAVSSGLRMNTITCNDWTFWVAPAGMQYQYLAMDSNTWVDGTISTEGNKTLELPQGFKGYVRLKVNTAENAASFPDTTLTIQSFSFQCDRFGGEPVLQNVYSVRDYSQYILENNYTLETKSLVKQMLNYGAKAQAYFGHKTDELPNLGYEVESAGTIGTESPEVAVNGSVAGISFYGCTMMLESTLAIRYYFKAPGGIDGYTFKVGGVETTPVAKNGMFYVEEEGITPDRMDALTTVTVTKGEEELFAQYSPMYYITRMYNKPSTTQQFKELLLAAAGYFEAAKVFTGVAENEKISKTIELTPLCGTQDDTLELNPDRGWRLEAYVDVANIGTQTNSDSELIAALENYKEYNPQLCQVYFYLTGFKDTETISQEGFDRMQQVFDTARARGIRLIVRFAYQDDMETANGEASDEIMLAHMPQLKPILENNTDVIHTVEAGFLGVWGEWHSYKMEHDELAILKGILDMVPESLYVQVRYPRVRNMLADAEPDNPNLSRMGYHDDSFFGWQYARWNDGLNPGDEYWEQMRTESPYRPQGGEMFWGCQYDPETWAPTTGALAIRKYSAFHQNSFSLFHSFIEDSFVHWVIDLGPDVGYYSMRDWLTEPITQQWLDSNGIVYDPLWFQNENGETVERTAFAFVHDHLGYRLRALDVTLDGNLACGDTLNVSMNLKNTGFSAVFNMESGFAVLDKDGNVVSSVAAGDPTTWLSADPETNAALTHNMAASLTLPKEPGTYQIAFYLRNSAGTGARLANDLQFMGGYTVLQTIVLR